MSNKEAKRINVRMHPDVYETLMYWADKLELSVNDFIVEGILAKIAWQNQDYPLPTMEQQRLFQILGAMESMSTRLENVESAVLTTSQSLLVMATGDTTLLDEDDGELVSSIDESTFDVRDDA